MAHLLEIVHTGFDTLPWVVAIDGFYIRTRKGHVRSFATDGAAGRALRKEMVARGLEYVIPHLRYERESGEREVLRR